jgi:hypothetical protein
VATVRELVTKLGFDADTKAAQDYDKTLADIRRTATLAAAAVTALAVGTVTLARRMASSGNEVAKSAVEAGLAAGEFQRLTFAIGQVTRLSSQQAQQALLRLNDTIGRARIEGGRYAESLQMLGFTQAEISSGNIDNAEAFARVTEALGKTANAQDAAALASRVLGERVGRQLGPALRLNAEAMVRAREDAERLGGGWSDLALGEAEELTDSFARVGLITTTLNSTIAETLLPTVREGVDAFVEWFAANRELIQQNMRRWMEGLASAMRVVSRIVGELIRGVDAVVQKLGGGDRTIRLVVIALSTLAALRIAGWAWAVTGALVAAARAGGLLRLAMLALSRIPIIALFSLLVLLIEDLIVWITGGNSAIGQWLGTWEDFRETAKRVIDDVLDFIKPLIRQFLAFGEILAGVFELDVGRIMQGLRDLSIAMLDWVANLGKLLWDALNFLGILPPRDEVLAALAAIGRVMVGWAKDIGARIWRNLLGGVGRVVSGVAAGARSVGERVAGVGEFFRGGRDPGNDVRSLGSSRRIEVNARTEATLQVPQGTSDEQRRAIERQAKDIFSEHWDREMRRALWNFQPVE